MGGNIFKNSTGQSLTTRINKIDVKPTVAWLENVLNLDLINNLLGSTGKSATSGDLDIAIDESELSKDDLIHKLVKWVKHNNEQPREWIKKSGTSVHFKTPILGKIENGCVQTDFMFGNPEWMRWAMKGGQEGSQFKGVHRHILMASVAKAQDLKWSFKNGLLDRSSDEVITTNPEQIAKTLLGNDADASDLDSVETIIRKLKSKSNYDHLISDFKEYLSNDVNSPKLENLGMDIGSPEWFRYINSKFN
jgi:hypothetical protein